MSAIPPGLLQFDTLPEKPWQRIAAMMFGTGSPVHEISKQVNQPVPVISDFITSKRGSELVKEAISQNADRLEALLEAAAVDSLLVLIKIRDNSGTPSAQIAACKELLSRTLPTVKAKDQNKKAGSRNSEAPDAEINRLLSEINRA